MGSIHRSKKKEPEIFDELWLSIPQKTFERKETLIARTIKEAVEQIIFCNKSKEQDFEKRLGILEEKINEKPILKNISLYDLNSEKYSLKIPINILLEVYNEEVIAKFPEIEAWGSGTTESEAIYDLKDQILSIYKDLLELNKSSALGKLPRMWLQILERLIERKKK